MRDGSSDGSARLVRVSTALLADQVFEQLRSWITSGEWGPGTPMRIREVATRVGTSEMPVREAFRRLEQAGLIVVEPYRGASVRVLTIDELEDAYDVRRILEPEAARRGTAAAGPEVVATMRKHRELLYAASDRGDIAEAVKQDEYFLTAIYSASRNALLMQLIDGVWDSCRPYKSLWVENAVGHGLSAWSHIDELIESVASHDAERSFEVLERTYREAHATVRQLLSGHDRPVHQA